MGMCSFSKGIRLIPLLKRLNRRRLGSIRIRIPELGIRLSLGQFKDSLTINLIKEMERSFVNQNQKLKTKISQFILIKISKSNKTKIPHQYHQAPFSLALIYQSNKSLNLDLNKMTSSIKFQLKKI